MTTLEKYNQINPIITEVKKDGFTLEIRQRGYFILVNGKVNKKGIRLSEELKSYFGV